MLTCLLLRPDPTKRLGRGDDGNALVALECEQISVAGNDEIGGGFDRTGEHVIVIGVAHDAR